jgi:cell shape-determining protein MreC
VDTSIIIAILGAASGVLSYFLGSRKRRAETMGIELRNMQLALGTWKEIVEHQTDEIVALRAGIEDLRRENRELRNEVAHLNEKLNNVKTITKTK